jgi:hypothetical protein
MTKVRLATFNCENLFSRPKVLNYADNEAAREPLNRLAKLDALLGRRTYLNADKRRILELLRQLRPYVDLNELRGKLVGKKGSTASSEMRSRPTDAPIGWVGSP